MIVRSVSIDSSFRKFMKEEKKNYVFKFWHLRRLIINCEYVEIEQPMGVQYCEWCFWWRSRENWRSKCYFFFLLFSTCFIGSFHYLFSLSFNIPLLPISEAWLEILKRSAFRSFISNTKIKCMVKLGDLLQYIFFEHEFFSSFLHCSTC